MDITHINTYSTNRYLTLEGKELSVAVENTPKLNITDAPPEEKTCRHKWTKWEDVPLVLNTREAAELLGFCPGTVKKKAAAGEIKGIQTGRDWRFTKEAIREYLDNPK